MGCVDSRTQQNENKPASTPENLLHRMELLTSATTLQSESDQEQIFNRELDRFLFYFNQSNLVKNEAYQKNIQEMNKLRQENNLDSFMKARQFDMQKSIKMFKEHLYWRKENKIDTILKDFVFWESDEVQEIYPHGYHKTDKEGRPIYIEIFKNVTFSDLYSITTQERMKKHYYQNYEQLINKILPCASIAANKYVGQTLTILDAKDMKLKPMEAKNFVQLVTSFSESNYPEIMGNIKKIIYLNQRLYVVNSPLLAQVFWKVISVMLNETIKSKICILGKDYKQKLLETIDKENLPEFLGGESDTQNGAFLRKNIGPWNDFGKKNMFPHEDEKVIAKITQDQKEQLKQDIYNFKHRRYSVQERASQRNSVSQRQSIIKIQQNEVTSHNQNKNDNIKDVDYTVNILDNLDQEQIPK